MGQIQPENFLQHSTTNSRQPIDTLPVLFRTIRLQSLWPAMARPCLKLRTLSFISEERNSVAARICHSRDLYHHDRPGILASREFSRKGGEFRFMRFDYTAVPIQTKNVGRSLERTEHQDNSAIFFKMSDGLHSAAVEIHKSYGGGAKNAKCVQPLRRKVDVPACIERR